MESKGFCSVAVMMGHNTHCKGNSELLSCEPDQDPEATDGTGSQNLSTVHDWEKMSNVFCASNL